MSEQAPYYHYLGHPVDTDDLTPDARAILAASETELGVTLAFESDLPGEIGELLDAVMRRGWWVQIKTPFSPNDLYWAGLTPLGTTGWNGHPDFQVGDRTLRSALWKAMLLAFSSGNTP